MKMQWTHVSIITVSEIKSHNIALVAEDEYKLAEYVHEQYKAR